MWQVDAETRAMLDRMKAPKKIDASAAAEPPVEGEAADGEATAEEAAEPSAAAGADAELGAEEGQ